MALTDWALLTIFYLKRFFQAKYCTLIKNAPLMKIDFSNSRSEQLKRSCLVMR